MTAKSIPATDSPTTISPIQQLEKCFEGINSDRIKLIIELSEQYNRILTPLVEGTSVSSLKSANGLVDQLASNLSQPLLQQISYMDTINGVLKQKLDDNVLKTAILHSYPSLLPGFDAKKTAILSEAQSDVAAANEKATVWLPKIQKFHAVLEKCHSDISQAMPKLRAQMKDLATSLTEATRGLCVIQRQLDQLNAFVQQPPVEEAPAAVSLVAESKSSAEASSASAAVLIHANASTQGGFIAGLQVELTQVKQQQSNMQTQLAQLQGQQSTTQVRLSEVKEAQDSMAVEILPLVQEIPAGPFELNSPAQAIVTPSSSPASLNARLQQAQNSIAAQEEAEGPIVAAQAFTPGANASISVASNVVSIAAANALLPKKKKKKKKKAVH